jgi:hypothetical protein
LRAPFGIEPSSRFDQADDADLLRVIRVHAKRALQPLRDVVCERPVEQDEGVEGVLVSM